jgi:hypothetical protein
MADENENQAKPNDTATPPPAAPAGMDPEAFNRAFTERWKRQEQKLQKDFEAREARLLALIEEGKSRAADSTPPVEGEHSDKKVERMAAKVIKEAEARMKAEVDQLKADRANEVKQRQVAEERAAVEGALRDLGVVNVKGALAYLKSEGLVGRDEAGELKFFQPKDGYKDELEVAKGVKDWLSTEDGKFYLPPVGAQGSGSTGARSVRRAGGSSPAEKQAEAASVLDQWIGGVKK